MPFAMLKALVFIFEQLLPPSHCGTYVCEPRLEVASESGQSEQWSDIGQALPCARVKSLQTHQPSRALFGRVCIVAI